MQGPGLYARLFLTLIGKLPLTDLNKGDWDPRGFRGGCWFGDAGTDEAPGSKKQGSDQQARDSGVNVEMKMQGKKGRAARERFEDP